MKKAACSFVSKLLLTFKKSFDLEDLTKTRKKLLGARIVRVTDDLISGSFFGNYAAVHEDDLVRNIMGEFDLMGNDHHGESLIFQHTDYIQYFAGQFRIQRGSRLVKA